MIVCRFMEDIRADLDMMRRCMVFGEIVSQVDATTTPINEKLTLTNAIANPIKTHVDGFGAALFDGVVGEVTGGAVICLNGCGGLRMPKFFKSNPHGTSFFGVLK